MGQTQSVMRWIAQSCRGRRGEILYPGKMNYEACYEIDSLIEFSDSYLNKFSAYMNPPVSEEKGKELCTTSFRDILTRIDEQLCLNPNPNFLVGNSLTTADIALGAYMLKFALNDTHVH